ncbi:PfkB family carbohydrate kinase [Couchioplanes caeruleus]|uniref:Carbohydrate kinase n=2 Tax=Couchioplanes caeruleus TaxID=56438 RepID=A0A1K0GXY8_9ACTN|nr:PfkB family carbohydrate kinase [Couchioplanes caeruleus]OJF14299.1 carbohydrate kinase [Couchioplanes caeruleus subsp. caeruleus]ROP27727.1 sugar/nucleoside kinase (ribokinase family) [Couchioplanes caeruleus]
MRLVCVGLATVDLVQRVDRVPGVDEKAEALSAEVAAGGPATNAAVTAAALGAEVTLVSAVGAHPLGDLIRADLAAHGVDLLDAAPRATAPPPVSAVTVLDRTGQRTIVSRNARGAEVGVPEDLERTLRAADAVLADGHHPALARAAAHSGRPLVLDAGSWRPVFADLLPRAALTACSAAFRPPGDRPVAQALRELGASRGAITHGPDPVRWWSGDATGEIEVPPVEAVDTAGAGDAFHGALTVALARGATPPEAIRYAITIAGIRVRHRGPRSWLAALS